MCSAAGPCKSSTTAPTSRRYIEKVTQPSPEHPVLIDKYLQGREVEVDAICDGRDALIPGNHGARRARRRAFRRQLRGLPASEREPGGRGRAARLHPAHLRWSAGVRGLVNIQYVLFGGEVYVLEVNPRASRTVPFLSKATGVPMVKLATRVMFDATLADLGYRRLASCPRARCSRSRRRCSPRASSPAWIPISDRR